MSGAGNRRKGHSFERKIAQDFREAGFHDAKTKREARGGDWSQTDDGVDLVDTGKWAVQVKCMKDYCPVSTIEEIHCDSPMSPFVITSADRKPVMAILPWEVLKDLIRNDQATRKN